MTVEKSPAGFPKWSSTYFVDRRVKLGAAELHFTWRRADGLMGRFGGGWNWKIGVQWSSWRSIIFDLLVAELRFTWKKPD